MRGFVPPLPNTSSWRGAYLSTGTTLLLVELINSYVRGPFEKFVDWRQCAAVMRREAVTVMPSCSGGDNVVVA
jgi:hypothetical protein